MVPQQLLETTPTSLSLSVSQGSVDNPGINQPALKHLSSEIEERKDMWSYMVTVSSVEVYNEVLRLDPSFLLLPMVWCPSETC